MEMLTNQVDKFKDKIRVRQHVHSSPHDGKHLNTDSYQQPQHSFSSFGTLKAHGDFGGS